LEKGEAHIFEMYRELRKTKKKARLKPGSYQNFRNYIYILARLGLIEFTREEPPANPHLANRKYYKLTKKGREKPHLFTNPRKTLYG